MENVNELWLFNCNDREVFWIFFGIPISLRLFWDFFLVRIPINLDIFFQSLTLLIRLRITDLEGKEFFKNSGVMFVAFVFFGGGERWFRYVEVNWRKKRATCYAALKIMIWPFLCAHLLSLSLSRAAFQIDFNICFIHSLPFLVVQSHLT